MSGVRLDFWCANAAGAYSGESAAGTSGQTYLRGWQTSGAAGLARVQTQPYDCGASGDLQHNHYPGRTTHVHLRVRAGASYNDTTQLYFPDAITATLLSLPAYNSTANAASRWRRGSFATCSARPC